MLGLVGRLRDVGSRLVEFSPVELGFARLLWGGYGVR